MKISYPWLKEFVAVHLDSRAMAQALNESAFDTELTSDPNVFEVKLPPNRVGDASGHLGFAKEVSRIAQKPVRYPSTAFRESRETTKDLVEVKVLDTKLCRRYTAAYAHNVHVKRSPAWMQKHLEECGVRPINAVVDITNYVMLEYGQPLHAFDADKLSKNKKGKTSIVVRRAQKGETITTLEDKEYPLDGTELLICDAKNPLAVAGIKGGRAAEIDAHTSRIVIESANFDPISVRHTSRSLGIRTDASVRFENDMDPNLTERALRRACALMQQICDADIAKGFLDAYPVKIKPVRIRLSLDDASRVIGTKISSRIAEQAFAPFCDSVKKQAQGRYVLTVHTMRRDIKIPEDAIEEIARCIGYDAIKEETVSEPVRSSVLDEQVREKWQFQDALVRLGFTETMNYSLIEEKDIASFRFVPESFIRITQSVSGKYTHLRPGLLVGLLKNVHDNARYFPSAKLFEIGHVYTKRARVFGRAGGMIPDEESHLGLAEYGATGAHKQFLHLKGSIESVFASLGISPETWGWETEKNLREYEPSECAQIKISGHIVGFMGTVKKDLTEKYGIDAPVSYAELFMDSIYALRTRKIYEPLPRYPDALRDVSAFIPADMTIRTVSDIIRNAASARLVSLELFDVFEKSGKKSVSFHLVFRSLDRTLTEREVDEDMRAIQKVLEHHTAVIR